MTRLNNHYRKQLINTLQNGASYRDTLDFSYFLHLGITQAEIGTIDYVCDQLNRCPWLEETDFINKGVSLWQCQNILGGFKNFRELLGIEDYSFSDWLEQQDMSNGLAIPYFLYQKFATEIRQDFMENMRLQHNLNVVLSNEQQFQYINVHDVAECVIPATDIEAAVATILMFCVTHKYKSLDTMRSVVEIEDKITEQIISIEVKCLASKFNERTDLSVCVIDDTTPKKGMPKLRDITLLQDLAST
ncbi:hypothetical protein [Vibrio astriarenae]|uniref:hypothetical protein n=1 Tax=Vibrio astriarenae TaxID=1481923 RepID=UPI003736EDFB